jgi:hypothetical protein
MVRDKLLIKTKIQLRKFNFLWRDWLKLYGKILKFWGGRFQIIMKEQEISMMKFTYSWVDKDLKTNRVKESQVCS